MNTVLDPGVLEALRAAASEFVDIRRDIHRHPELGFKEHRTSALVAARLKAWGYEVDVGLGGTGVVGTLRRGTGSRSIGIRADMDALPIAEASGRAWASEHPGLMHACGHDGHTAILLAAARQLAEGGEFSGTVHLIFQPAEEGLGGAVKMMDDGLFERHPCDAIFALHNSPGVPQGTMVFRDGPMMASSDAVKITLDGRGGHAAFPHRAADPVVAAASFIMALQTVVSRNVDPLHTAVVSVGTLHAGTAVNVIPETCTIELSVRALDPAVRDLLEERITSLARTQAESFGVRATVEYRRGYAVLVNSKPETDFARQVALDLLGPGRVVLEGPQVTGSEDFSFMLQKRPGCYLLIGNGDGEGSCMVHNPGYDFNDDNIATGSTYWVALVQRWLQA